VFPAQLNLYSPRSCRRTLRSYTCIFSTYSFTCKGNVPNRHSGVEVNEYEQKVVQICAERRGGLHINIAPPNIMDLPSQFFSAKGPPPNSIYTRAGEA
jgi:hypothetical protein